MVTVYMYGKRCFDSDPLSQKVTNVLIEVVPLQIRSYIYTL